VIKVRPRSRHREDRAGDPLDGLVNLFDLGIVLSVAFLLAALSALNLNDAITDRGLTPTEPGTIQIAPDEQLHELPRPGEQVVGRGVRVGTVYRLPDGRLVYVAPSNAPTGGGSTGESE
jgi:hypothetical protein